MRIRFAIVPLTFGLLFVAPDSDADSGVEITGFRVLTDAPRAGVGVTKTAGYSAGEIEVEVAVANGSSTPATNVVVKLDTGAVSAPITVPAKGNVAVKLKDSAGLTSSCHTKNYLVTVEIGTESHSRQAIVTPTCKLTSKVVDYWTQAVNDRVVEAQKDTIWLDRLPTIESATCSAGIKIKTKISNRTKSAVASLVVQGKDSAGVVRTATAAAFPLGAGETKDIELVPYGSVDVPDKVSVSIIDWAHALKCDAAGKHCVVNRQLDIETTRSCTLTGNLLPNAAK